MNTQFRKGVIEMCVLALIERKDMYGYEIVQSIAYYTEINEGTVYPILRRLTQEEYFVTYLKESTVGHFAAGKTDGKRPRDFSKICDE